jgi:lambda family phage minor tail protein L
MTDLIDTVQLSEINDELIELFDITLPGYSSNSGAGKYYLCNGEIDQDNDDDTDIVFNGNTYLAIPIQITGIEFNSSGAYARPTLTIANIPNLTKTLDTDNEAVLEDLRVAGTAGIEAFERNDELIGTKIIYRKTLKGKLSTGEEFPSQTYYIDRVASENNLFVAFELASPMDIEGAQIPARMVIGRYCSWQYQGRADGLGGGCTYPNDSSQATLYDYENNDLGTVDSISTWGSVGYSQGDIAKTITGSKIEIWEALFTHSSGKDPRHNRRYWKRIDLCQKTLTACKLRFQGSGGTANQAVPLPFGGFPGSKKYR